MKWSLLWLFGLIALLLAACSTGVAPESDSPGEAEELSGTVTESPTTTLKPLATATEEQAVDSTSPAILVIEQIDLATVPDIDVSQNSVPLDEIIFDTFQPVNRAVSLTKAQPALIRSLRDAIPPLYEPRFTTTSETDRWLSDSDIVLGYAAGEEAYAYPVKILNFHEMVSHEVNGRDILASYCPLCRSGIVYDRLLPETNAPLVLGNTSALYESDMVMFDHQTGSYWNQVSAEAIVGPLTGKRLSILPSQMTTWGMWKVLYPDTLALDENTGFQRDYRRDPFAGYGVGLNSGGRFFFPVSEIARDARLDPGEIVLGLEVDGMHRAYPLALLGDTVTHDIIGQTEVVIFSRANGPSGAVYSPIVDDHKLTFVFEEDRITDRETGSTWNMAGQAIEGQLAGTLLQPLPARSTMWFSLVANFPEIDVYDSGD